LLYNLLIIELSLLNDSIRNGAIEILDISGRVLIKFDWNGEVKQEFTLPRLMEGMYFINLKTQSWIISKRFVKL